ncbi:(S)-1-Phenylethanol dehydrogenase [Gemmata obscuriglobus]|uniref:SDR family NAD(P)-dependent oxidoreductase n=1 Tax=Gemmata obscuriglobus TaxID=114 RepID=A0A2Z3H1A4_9BACT|nr:SDR family oxidoreductase [Gemmata obscuriglobus]AWM38631.1 SDR family NAD(P)-dependent oxidoreductase [Gemmata obscuriglobus]QEG28410.1 (S)-1-Phenylethanol dehydrogenase [Gemmata obscuriglobus]VTS06357.1 short-chain alcohol dehydrogenase : (S)-1-phenylethanol dehydrogenase Ped OS=Methyloglobulus morosus KoM1 GN=ped PE=3 SV=1: adh_short [Gemmata obscuriglobus UQM 2246]
MDSRATPLAGRSAVVTGANQGLGRVIAEHLVRAGASVLLTARGADLLTKTAAELLPLACVSGQKVLTRVADVAKEADCNATAAQAFAELNNPCVLVNNAGVYGPFGLVEENDWAEWVKAIEINLFGTILMCRAFLPRMREAQYGKIINLSGGGATAPLPRISSYAASKAAVVRFTETLAEETRGAGIDVNAVAPGALNTRLMDDLIAAGPEKVGAAFFDKMTKTRDSGGTPLDKGAELSVFLASAASDGISGRLISAVWDDWQNLPTHSDQLASSDIYTLRRITPDDRGGWKKCA